MPLFIDDQKMSRKQILAELGLTEEQIPKSDIRKFTLSTDLVKRDTENANRLVYPKSHNFPPYYTVNGTDGTSHVFRYAKSWNHGRNGLKYNPSYMSYFENEFGVNDTEEFLWFFLNPRVKQSPLRNVNESHDFEFMNVEDMADAYNDNMDDAVKALALVYGDHALSLIQMRQLLKAFGVEAADKLSLAQAKSNLAQRVGRNPVEFYNKAVSKTVRFDGTILDAIDKQILVKSVINGVVIWKFKGKDIFTISNGTDPVSGIKDFISLNMASFYEDILNALDGRISDTAIEAIETDKYFPKYSIETAESLTKTDLGTNPNRIIKDSLKGSNDDRFLEEFSGYDPEDPTFHHMKKQKYIANRERIEAYKLTKLTEKN